MPMPFRTTVNLHTKSPRPDDGRIMHDRARCRGRAGTLAKRPLDSGVFLFFFYLARGYGAIDSTNLHPSFPSNAKSLHMHMLDH